MSKKNNDTEHPSSRKIRIALAGNPNSGKSSLFNSLTGLKQKIGNYPGVTVDKKTGFCSASVDGKEIKAEIIDLPGAYGLRHFSEDEHVSTEVLTNRNNPDFPDAVIYVADASNLKRSLLLCSQIIDSSMPVVLALNMVDVAEKKGLEIDCPGLSEQLGLPVFRINAREKTGVDELLVSAVQAALENPDFVSKNLPGEKERKKSFLRGDEEISGNGNETLVRYNKIETILRQCVRKNEIKKDDSSKKLDDILTHRIWGFVIFLGILFVVFQAIFSFSEIPMKAIETGFVYLGNWLAQILPSGILKELLIGGIVAGLSGIAIFIPQIALLFFFISILEDSGYLARVSFIMDRIMRRFGLNGKSLIPLISGIACAVPAIMSARTISNRKERLITILVTPIMTCSARIPVYILLISLFIPDTKVLGIINIQGLTLMALYLLGFVAALSAAFIMQYLIKSKERSYFIMEMPPYKPPRWINIGLTMIERVKVFVFDAGRIIIAISVVLWALASFSPGSRFEEIEQRYHEKISLNPEQAPVLKKQLSAEKLENSYAALLGKTIEPIIAPLGFDWKIGIALVTSFAAREVFVGTMGTLYGVGDTENTLSVREKMSMEVNPHTGEKIYSLATCFSLIIYYAFAMQCMSTLAVVFRETGKMKWPLLQLVYMTGLAYLLSFLVYRIFQ